MLMLMFRSVSKNTFFENRLNDGGVNFINALSNATKKICRCSMMPNGTPNHIYDFPGEYGLCECGKYPQLTVGL